MGRWNPCFLFLLTCLTVAALALLPPRLSVWKDSRQAGVVQWEAQPEDSNFPARPPDLPERIRLAALYRRGGETLTVVQQLIEEPEALAEARALMDAELEALTAAGILPSGQPVFHANFTAVRLYLRDQADLSSAGFLMVWSSDRYDYDLSMVLDLETGQALSFRLMGPAVLLYDIPPDVLGTRFLNRLYEGLVWEEDRIGPVSQEFWADWRSLEKQNGGLTVFRLEDTPVRYYALASPRLLSFAPELEEPDGGGDDSVSVKMMPE